MIVQSVVLQNFGVFRGRHEIDFAPSSPQRPVVLIGAMNGSGKTTILEALKLALFGRRATDLSRGARTYEEYLAESVNRDVPMSEGASVEITFTVMVAGRDCSYRIVRSWASTNGQVRESFEVSRDAVRDPVLGDGWSEHVESILPVRLAPFFLFDGERLETLADFDRAREFLANAIEALLGLDIVDRLGDDLRSVERRIKEDTIDSPDDQDDLIRLKALAEDCDTEVRHLVQRCGEITNVIEQSKRAAQQAERDLEAMSGDLPQRSLSLQKARASCVARRSDAMSKLMQVAYEAGPLLLLTKNLHDALARADPDELEPELLRERDKQVLAAMRRRRVSAEVLNRLERVLSEDVSTRHERRQARTGAPRAVLVEATHLVRHVGNEVRALAAAVEALDVELAEIEEQISALPTEHSLQPLLDALRERKAAVALAEAEFRVASEALERARIKRDRAEEGIQAMFAAAMEHAKQQRYVAKLVSRSNELRQTLELFRTRMSARHATRLGDEILDAFQCLHRKVGAIERIVVDSRTFEMALWDRGGRRIDPSRLSAGERQLLAVAMVWAILKLADRPLPLWIDTPLGRLDSLHRRHLVERFFPYAAPQVVLFSTDTEIDQEALEALAPHVSRTYLLEFDPTTRASRCVNGYFLEDAA